MAESESNAEELEKLLNCFICNNIFTDPKTLSCLHTYCTKCIAQSYDARENHDSYWMECPKCKTTTRLPEGDPLKLPSSFYINSLLQLLQATKTQSQQNTIKSPMFCKEHLHEENQVEYFCQEDNRKQCGCQECVLTFHQDHQLQSLKEAVREIEDAMQVKEQYEKELEDSQKNMAKIWQEIESAKKEVRRAEEMICTMMRDHSTTMISALDQTLQEQTAANDEEQNEIKKEIKQITEYLQLLENLKDRGVANDSEECKKELQDKSHYFVRKNSILSTRSIQHDTTVRYVTNEQFLKSLGKIGKVVKSLADPSKCTIESLENTGCGFVHIFHVFTRDSEGEFCLTRNESIDVRIKDVEGNEVENAVFEEQTGKYRVSFKPHTAGPYEIQVNIGGESITNNSPPNEETCTSKTDLGPQKSFGEEGSGKGQLHCPQSIAVRDNGEIAIADSGNHCIQIFSLYGQYISELRNQGTEGQLFEPSVAVFDGDKIIVSDCKMIQEFDFNGGHVRTVYTNGQLLFGLCVNDDKNIAVCCGGDSYSGIKPSIKVISKQGHLIDEFYMTSYDEQPEYIIYANQRYFVSFFRKNCVRVFYKNGASMFKFGQEGERDGQFDGVSGLAIYGRDMILACDYNNHRVQLFTQEGQFIKSFGCYASGNGRMDGPIDAAVTPDGRVFVLEMGSCRIQVWQ